DAGAGPRPAGAGGGQGGRKKKGAAWPAAPVPIPAVDLVEALTYSARCRWRVARRPPRWLGGSLQVSGTRPYPLVPPLPVLEDFTTGPPPFRGKRNVGATAGQRKAPTLDRGGPSPTRASGPPGGAGSSPRAGRRGRGRCRRRTVRPARPCHGPGRTGARSPPSPRR